MSLLALAVAVRPDAAGSASPTTEPSPALATLFGEEAVADPGEDLRARVPDDVPVRYFRPDVEALEASLGLQSQPIEVTKTEDGLCEHFGPTDQTFELVAGVSDRLEGYETTRCRTQARPVEGLGARHHHVVRAYR